MMPESMQAKLQQSYNVLKDLPGLNLPALEPLKVNRRTLALYRNISGDFGFNFRRTQITDVNGQMKIAVFAEPTKFRYGPPRPNEIKSNLLPGDKLIMVNGCLVDNMGRDELISLIQSSKDKIELTVEAMPELAEFFDQTQRSSLDIGDALMLSSPNAQNFANEQGREEDYYWLRHKSGYTMVHLCEKYSDGKIRINVSGSDMVVDVTDIDKANPSLLDRVENFIKLRYVNETGILHVLRHRFGSNLLYTFNGSQNILCMAGDYRMYACDKLAQLFKGYRKQHMSPHIYSFAQQIYRNMQMSSRNQCVFTTGISGSGKSFHLRNICHYLCEVADRGKKLSYDKLSASFGILEAFGNCSTKWNQNASRFAQALTLSFSNATSLNSAWIQTFLLERSRVVLHSEYETTFQIFYYLLEGADDHIINHLALNKIGKVINTPFTSEEDKNVARLGWEHLNGAFEVVGVTDAEKSAIFAVLGAILHLIHADAVTNQSERSCFIRKANAQRAADLLGISLEDLTVAVFKGKINSTVANSVSFSRLSMVNKTGSGSDVLNRFIASLYQELFDAVVSLVNRCIGSSNSTMSCRTITVIDYPGSNFGQYHAEEGEHISGLNDLIYNYMNERVAELFYEINFTKPSDLYEQEQVDVTIENPTNHWFSVTRLMDQKQHLMQSVDIERRSEEKRGLLYLLDEEVHYPGATDDSFFERIFIHLGDSHLIRRGLHARQFIINHRPGSNSVVYGVNNWVKAASAGNASAGTSVLPLLTVSNVENIRLLFTVHTMPANFKIHKALKGASADVASLRATCGFVSKLVMQIDSILSFAQNSTNHFAHCIRQNALQSKDSFDVPFVRSQLRSLPIVEATRALTLGYPEQFSFGDFRRRFECSNFVENSMNELLDDRAAALRILETSGIFTHQYRLGLSQILLRSDALDDLEGRREVFLNGFIEKLQHICRRYLAHKWLAKRHVMEITVRCIQRNGVSYLKVHKWSWWRLYVRVLPLIGVSRSDREFQELEQRLNELKNINQKIRCEQSKSESRIADLEQLLSVECVTSKKLQEALDEESVKKVQLEKHVVALRHTDDVDSLDLIDSSLATDSKVVEMQKEIFMLRENENALQNRAQKAIERLNDVESEVTNLRARNDYLEKRNDGFDAELSNVAELYKKEKVYHAETLRECEKMTAMLELRSTELQAIKSECGELRQNLSRMRKDLESAEESNEPYSTEDQLMNLHRSKKHVEMKYNEQEKELEEMLERINLLEQTVSRLEITNERTRADWSREVKAKETEISDLRAQYQRRQQAQDEQLIDLRKSNESLVKQCRMLEMRMRESNSSCSVSPSGPHHKRDVKKLQALLRETQNLLARERDHTPNHQLMRQLQDQLEDAESAKLSAVKSRYHLESELAEIRAQLETALAAKNAAEEKVFNLLKERNTALALVEEHDEQLLKVMKKYKAAVQENAISSIKICDQYERLAELEKEKQKLQEELGNAVSSIDFNQVHSVDKHKLLLAEQKIHDLEAKLDVEIMQRTRLDALLVKAKDELESARDQLSDACAVRDKEIGIASKAKKESRAFHEQLQDFRQREAELLHKCKEHMASAERCELQLSSQSGELQTAKQRIKFLESTINSSLDGDDSENGSDIVIRNGSMSGLSRI